MYSIDRTSPIPIESHSLMSNETESEIESSTPELNLLLDKLTEILRFRSGCRRHLGSHHHHQQQQPQQQQTQSNFSSTTNLKRLQSGSIEPLHTNTSDVSSTGTWKSSNIHHKSCTSKRSLNHHHSSCPNNDKKRRLPSLLQRLIDEGNLIKEAVRRLKSQRFSHSYKQQQSNIANTPSTPTTKSYLHTLPNVTLSSASINIPQQLSDPPTQTTSSPSRGISWFLSSSVFGGTNHSSSGSDSPLRNCCPSSTHDRTSMEIGIHEG